MRKSRTVAEQRAGDAPDGFEYDAERVGYVPTKGRGIENALEAIGAATREIRSSGDVNPDVKKYCLANLNAVKELLNRQLALLGA